MRVGYEGLKGVDGFITTLKLNKNDSKQIYSERQTMMLLSMDNSDEIDDEVKRLLANTGSDDSKSSNKKDKKSKIEWEENDETTDDSEW